MDQSDGALIYVPFILASQEGGVSFIIIVITTITIIVIRYNIIYKRGRF